MENLKVKEKKVTVDEKTIIEKIIKDIKESDSDTLESIIESMYPVKATYEDGLVEIELDEREVDDDLTLEDIF